ncbi:MAG: type I DNA topoisomerase [Bacilli bacterium]
MAKNLVIVESPHKSKTIEKYLGDDYKVIASKGHIRDLGTSGKYGLGVDLENDFFPKYVVIPLKKKIVTELKKEVKNSDKIYLATDPDREGEAISWHLKEELGIKDDDYERVLFHEITKDKVLEAFNQKTKIDDNLVKSQETRRILDRIIGFRLSKLMQSKTNGKSAGRVQSVALKLIVEREREIEAFISEEYWTVSAYFNDVEARLTNLGVEKIELKNESDAQGVLDKLNKQFIIESKDKTVKKKTAKYPFITSTLQQEASNKLGFNAKRTMSIAQKLYEGIKLEDDTMGLITYMRTDSIRLSDEFVKSTYSYIDKEYGKEYVGYVKKGKKSELTQDAHEAIRPTDINNVPSKIKKYLTDEEYKLYKLIYARTLSSLMADAKVNATVIVLDNNNYKFKINGNELVFDGYLKVYKDYESSEESILPEYKEKVLEADEIEKLQHFTEPKARYTEAKLIKELEELGIGRPSTYARIMETIVERGYVVIKEKKFYPTETGFETTDKLQEYFSDIINVEYTRQMEADLDDIATNTVNSVELLHKFYDKFAPSLEHAFEQMEKPPLTETGELCPECNKPLVIRRGKYGEFVGCSNYPECKYIKKEVKEKIVVGICPKCNGEMLERKSKRGKVFYGCNNYPKCKFALWDKPVGEKCPVCGEELVIKKDIIKCSKCDYLK